jgi:hypothetical protein
VFAALNPSPIFEAVAMFAEKLPMKDVECSSKEINGQVTLRCRSGIGKGACPLVKMRQRQSSEI